MRNKIDQVICLLTFNASVPLKGYSRQRFFGILASGGSLYFMTTPL